MIAGISSSGESCETPHLTSTAPKSELERKKYDVDTTTRELVRQEKLARLAAREEKQQQLLVKMQTSWQQDWDKHNAIRDVTAAARRAVERLSIVPSKWSSKGEVELVCNRTGPHHGFWCLFHWRKRVTLMQIPGARGTCKWCTESSDSDYGSYQMHWSDDMYFTREQHRGLFLGSDGNIYRYGHTKIFRAKLMDREKVAHIRALIPKLDAME